MNITTSSLLFNDTFFRCKISINIQCLNWHTGTKKLQNSQTYSLKKCIQGGQNLPKKINIHVPQFETLEYVSAYEIVRESLQTYTITLHWFLSENGSKRSDRYPMMLDNSWKLWPYYVNFQKPLDVGASVCAKTITSF